MCDRGDQRPDATGAQDNLVTSMLTEPPRVHRHRRGSPATAEGRAWARAHARTILVGAHRAARLCQQWRWSPARSSAGWCAQSRRSTRIFGGCRERHRVYVPALTSQMIKCGTGMAERQRAGPWTLDPIKCNLCVKSSLELGVASIQNHVFPLRGYTSIAV